MGCTGSKPDSKKNKNIKDTKQKSKSNENKNSINNAANKQHQQQQQQQNGVHKKQLEQISHLNESIKIDKNLLDQIELHQVKVIEYIARIVHKDLNAELVSNGNKSNKSNFVAVALAASAANDNQDLITDIASRAILLIKTGKCQTTYKNLNDTLKQSQYLCKNQTHKNRICDITVETIRNCLNTIYEESHGGNFNLVDFLNDSISQNTTSSDSSSSNSSKNNVEIIDNRRTTNLPSTPPQTPPSNQTHNLETPPQSNKINWDNAVLLSRAQANEVARILFLSSRARPIIHTSPRVKDAYFVNKQLKDDLEVTVSQDEVDEILNSFDQPKCDQTATTASEFTSPSKLNSTLINNLNNPITFSSPPYTPINPGSSTVVVVRENLFSSSTNGHAENIEDNLNTNNGETPANRIATSESNQFINNHDLTNVTDETIQFETLNESKDEKNSEFAFATLAAISALGAKLANEAGANDNNSNVTNSSENAANSTFEDANVSLISNGTSASNEQNSSGRLNE